MVNMTLSIPEVLYKKMSRHSELKWSEIARMAFEERLKDSELLEDMKAIARAEQEHREGKTVSHKKLLKELGLDDGL